VAYWLNRGFISFGGPAGQIALMHRELVERRRWISECRFLHALNYSMVLPGPEAQQLATYIGRLTGPQMIDGLALGETTPGPLIMVVAFVGVIANVAACFALHVLWPSGLSGPFRWTSALIGIAAAVALFRFSAGMIAVVLGCGVAGWVLSLLPASG
jgi:chromate transporter